MNAKKSAETRPGFMVYLDLFPQLEEYSFEEVGMLFLDMCCYVEDGTTPEYEDRGLRVIWRSIQDRLDRDKKRYYEQIEKRRVDGLYGRYVQLCKAKGEKPQEKIVWIEEDYLPSLGDTQVYPGTLGDTQVYPGTLGGRRPTTTPASFPASSPASNTVGEEKGCGEKEPPHYTPTVDFFPGQNRREVNNDEARYDNSDPFDFGG